MDSVLDYLFERSCDALVARQVDRHQALASGQRLSYAPKHELGQVAVAQVYMHDVLISFHKTRDVLDDLFVDDRLRVSFILCCHYLRVNLAKKLRVR